MSSSMKHLSILLVALCSLALFMNGCTCSRKPAPEQAATTAATPDPNLLPDYSGITVQQVISNDSEPGTGAEVKGGSTVTGNYGMWIYDPKQLGNKGKEIAKSEEGKPMTFVVGKGDVIKGWDQGMIGMRKGGKRAIIIPPALAYGEKGDGKVPGNAIILVEFELVEVK